MSSQLSAQAIPAQTAITRMSMMIAPARLARILQPCKARCQPLDHAARPRSHRTETASTFLNQQPVPRSCVNPAVGIDPSRAGDRRIGAPGRDGRARTGEPTSQPGASGRQPSSLGALGKSVCLARSRRGGDSAAFARCQFDEQGCSLGLRRLRAYRKEWDESRGA
jgi:hypothetical protein